MAYRDSTASVFGSTTTLAATLPTMVAGDRVIAWAHVDLNGPTITPPSGWAQIGTIATPVFGAPLRAYNLTGGYTGSAPANTWTLSDPPFAGSIIVIASFSGRASTGQTFVTASSGGGGTSSFSASATGGTAAASDDVAALILCESVSDVATWSFSGWTGTAGYTEREDQAIDWAAMGLATQDAHAGGATGNVSATISNGTGQSGAWAAIVVALPSGGAPPAGSLPPDGGSRHLLTGRLPHLRMSEHVERERRLRCGADAAEVVRASQRAQRKGCAFSFLSA